MKKEKKPGCLECGSVLKQLPKKRAKKFCNSTCRSSYFQKTQRRLAKERLAEVEKKSGKEVIVKDKTKPKTRELKVSPQTNYSIDTRPKTLKELKEVVPANLTGLERSSWISENRKKYGI